MRNRITFFPGNIYSPLFWGLWLYVVVLVSLFWYKSVILMWLTVHWIAYYGSVEWAPLLSPCGIVLWTFMACFSVGFFPLVLFFLKDTVSGYVTGSRMLLQAVWSWNWCWWNHLLLMGKWVWAHNFLWNLESLYLAFQDAKSSLSVLY